MKKEFVMRGNTVSGGTEVLNFSGHTDGYAYRLTEFKLYPSSNLTTTNAELVGTITAGKVGIDPSNLTFNDEALIGTALMNHENHPTGSNINYTVINDLFLITQNLILMVFNSYGHSVNWQCRFVSVKMSDGEEAATNFKQFTISDG